MDHLLEVSNQANFYIIFKEFKVFFEGDVLALKEYFDYLS